MERIELHQPIDWPRLKEKIRRLFAVQNVGDATLVHGGYMSQNFRLDTDVGPFFFKQYRNRMSASVYEVKDSEEFFFKHGLPVIRAIPDSLGRDAFAVSGYWYSLFPFVEAVRPVLGSFAPCLIPSIGNTLGRFHLAGPDVPSGYHHTLRVWDRRSFFSEFAELEQELASRPLLKDDEQDMLDLLRLKARLVKENDHTIRDFGLTFDCLLHGDFIYQNVFTDTEGNVSHVFDFEKTSMGPAAYELARSLMITCFDDGWEERNIAMGRIFLAAYREVRDVSFDEFSRGMCLYALKLFHTTWIEARAILYSHEYHTPFYEHHAKRVEHLSEDVRGLCERLYA
jgi:Ser/Thr protein kinase RdoA (MazF antagonist)